MFPQGFRNTRSLYRNLTFFLEHSQSSLRLFSTCSQQNFQPHSPAGSKFYLEIFVTSQRIISKRLCRRAASTEQTSTPAAPGEAELPPPTPCIALGRLRKVLSPDLAQHCKTSSTTSHDRADAERPNTTTAICRCKRAHHQARQTARRLGDASG